MLFFIRPSKLPVAGYGAISKKSASLPVEETVVKPEAVNLSNDSSDTPIYGNLTGNNAASILAAIKNSFNTEDSDDDS